MIQVYSEERCPDWIKKKCNVVTETKSIVTFNVVVYESFIHFDGLKEVTFYIVRDKEISKEKVENIIQELII